MNKHSSMRQQEREDLMEREVRTMTINIFSELLIERKLCDVVIKVDRAEFHAHKIILCERSLYFKALFTNSGYAPDKHLYDIPGVSSEIMELIMEYMYTGCATITEGNVCDLLIAADYLAMDKLLNWCSTFLKAQLSLENCIGIWHFAYFYSCRKLEQKAFQFILFNFEEMVSVSEEFLDLTVEQLDEIIKNDELNVRQENAVFEAILLWIKHAPKNREALMHVLLPRVRMGLLKHEYFVDYVSGNTLVADNMACRPIIISVLKSKCGLVPIENLSSELMRPRLPSTVLLAIGGWSREGPTSAIEVYNPRANCWLEVPSKGKSPRAYHGTVYLSGFVYCIGGFDSENYFSSVRSFNPFTKTWVEAGPMHFHRCYVSTCVLNGHIYAMGGYDGHVRLNSAERYEPQTNQWSMIAPMHAHRSDASATILNNKVYICGGFDGNECLSTVEYYNPETDQWTLISAMRSRRSGLGVKAYGGEIFAVGGYNGTNRLNDAEAYNPQTGSWREIKAMTSQRTNFGIEVMDDLLFVIGGYNGFSTMCTVECYNKRTDEWNRLEDMGIFRSALSCCLLSGLPKMRECIAPQKHLPDPPHI